MSRISILIVEDDPFQAENLQLDLLGAGHHISAVLDSGEACIEHVRRGEINLLIVDIVLAGKIDGIEAVNKLRAFSDIPVIFLTSYVSDELLLRAERARPYAYLLKPYRQQELEFLIKMSLTRIQVERELRQAKADTDAELKLALSIIKSTTEGIVVTDITGTIIAVNPSFSKITGYSENEALGKKPELLYSDPHDLDFYHNLWTSLRRVCHWQGETKNRRKNGEVYPGWMTFNGIYDKTGKLVHCVGIFSDITEIKESEAKLHHQAHHDPLTGLPNRLLFMDRLRQAIHNSHRQSQYFALLFVDLDHFKRVNDSFGHVVGDKVLEVIAKRIKQAVRENDTVARLGGDEFVVLVELEEPYRHSATVVAQKMEKAISRQLTIEDQELVITVSCGICVYPQDGTDADNLLRNADTAMYRAKAGGRNNFQFYSEKMTAHVFERLRLESQLLKAINRDELELYFQPQVDLRSRTMLGVEALVRWRQPKQKLIMPDGFIPVAEETGLIIAIGDWVIQKACEQMSHWVNTGVPVGRIAVNLSGAQCIDPKLHDKITSALHATGCPPERLDLEVTESHIMRDPISAGTKLKKLRDMGLGIAVDDFGTGYSSLNYLKQLPLTMLKIDRSFIQNIPIDPDDTAITHAIIALGHSLRLRVLAEGVETEEQVMFLQEQGCDESQGFLFAKPMPGPSIELFLTETQRQKPRQHGLSALDKLSL